jgi:hypothetical protein
VGGIVVIAVAPVVDMASCAVQARRSPLLGRSISWRQEGVANGVVPTEEEAKHHGRRSLQLLYGRCVYDASITVPVAMVPSIWTSAR